MPDGTQNFFSLDGDTYSEGEYGVFVSGARKNIENLDRMKGLAQAYIQNDGGMSVVADILDSDNFAEIKRKIKAAEDAQAKQDQAIAEMKQQEAQAERETKLMEMQQNKEIELRKNATSLEEALIRVEGQKEVEAMKLAANAADTSADTALEQQRIDEEKRANRVEEALKRVDLEIKRKQANKPSKN